MVLRTRYLYLICEDLTHRSPYPSGAEFFSILLGPNFLQNFSGRTVPIEIKQKSMLKVTFKVNFRARSGLN